MSEEDSRTQITRMTHEADARFRRRSVWKYSRAILITAIVLTVAFVTFYPQAVIAVAHDRSPTDPLKVVVTLSDNNIVPLSKVKVWLDCHDIETIGGEIKNFEFSSMLWQAPMLTAHDKPEINLDSGFTVPPGFIQKAYISVRVEYQPWFIPLTRTKSFPFRIFRQSEGELRLVAVQE